MKVVDVLRQHSQVQAARPTREDLMRGIRLALGDLLAPPRVPLPHQPRITSKGLRRREILRFVAPPQPFGTSESRDSAGRRDTGASQCGYLARRGDAGGEIIERIIDAAVK